MIRPLVEVRNLHVHYVSRRGLFGGRAHVVRAVDDVSLTIGQGETLGLVGESGSGKTTLGRALLRAVPVTAGRVAYQLQENDPPVDLLTLGGGELRRFRQHVQMVFQDPYASLNPRMTVRDLIAEPLVVNRLARGDELDLRVREAAKRCRLNVEHLRRYPHAFSGGQRQRIGIARAIVSQPAFIVCDEAVSALDVSIRAEVLNLLVDLQRDLGMSYCFIGHDLGVVAHVSHRIAVMYLGQVVELAPTASLFAEPLHPYTEALLRSIPMVDIDAPTRPIALRGDVPDPADPPPGCVFHTRCAYAEARCRVDRPQLEEQRTGRFVACHLGGTLSLEGARGTQAPATPAST